MKTISKKKIIIVEDDTFLAELLVKKLEEAGFDVNIAMEGKEALTKIQQGSFDLVLLDLVLPGLSGFDILKELKKDAKLKSIPVVILSNLGDKKDIEMGFALGAKDYLVKAHHLPAEIVKKVVRILRES